MRVLIALACLAGVAPAAAESPSLEKRLQAIVDGGDTDNPLAGVALAVRRGDEIIFEGAAGCAVFKKTSQNCARPMRADTKVRVASISKMAAAMAANALAAEGKLDLDRDVSDYLGWTLRNPAFPDAPITARQLGAHVSSIRDPEEYWVVAPGKLKSLFVGAPPFAESEAGASRTPGDYFTYANLNYGVLASVMEKAAGERFDEIVASRVLRPLGLDAGFNWSGVPKKARRRGGALYRRVDGEWATQVDGEAMLNAKGPYFLREEGLDAADYLDGYEPGDNATLFSPQGGLRASALDLLNLVLALPEDPPVLWRYDQQIQNGDTEDGFYQAFGFGLQMIEDADAFLKGARFVGHSGEAYGLYSGAWRLTQPDDPETKEIDFAFVVTGVSAPPADGAHPTFNAVEETLVRLALDAAGADARKDIAKNEPRPFDETRDAMADVDMALAVAKARGVNVLLVLGGNWCHDSRGLAAKFETADLARLIADSYELVWVDVGMRNRNLDIAKRFGVPELFGTPTILIVSPEGALLNADSVHDWRNAHSRTIEETAAYFERWASVQ